MSKRLLIILFVLYASINELSRIYYVNKINNLKKTNMNMVNYCANLTEGQDLNEVYIR